MYLHPRLLALTEGVRLRIFAAALVGLMAVAAGIGRLVVAAVVIVKVLQDGASASYSSLIWPLVAMGCLVALRGALLYLQEGISHHTASIVKIQLRKRLYEHALAMGPGHFEQKRTGNVMLTMADGVETLEVFFGTYLPQFIVSVLGPVLIFIFMAVIDLQIGFIFLGFALSISLMPSLFHRWNRDSSMARRQAYGALGAEFLDAVQGLGTLKAFGQSKIRGRLLADRARHLYRESMGVLAADSATGAITILGISAGAAAALVSGALRVSDGSLELRPLLIVLMLGAELFRPLHELVRLYHQGLMAMSSAESIFDILDSPVEIKEPTGEPSVSLAAGNQEVSQLTPEIRFEEVDFAYNQGKRPALHGVSFTLGAGETLGLVGASGAGKSTVVWLTLRFHDPQNGRVLLGGRDVRELPLAFLRQHIAVVAQDTYLFHGTVADNLRFGNPDATQEQLEVAARAANAHKFIVELPSGYDTLVGERASRLSGGQKQRIAIARALLKDAPILVLDEALSSVDAENEAVIQEALERLMEGRTTLIIAHRLSSVVNADRILVLDDGRLIESGSHQELVAAGGAYSRLMAQQYETSVHKEMVATLERGDTGDPGQDGHEETVGIGPFDHPQVIEEQEGILTEGVHKETAAPARPNGILTVWARLLYLVRPWWGQLALTFAMGLGHHGSIIGVGVISALLVGQVITGGELTLLLVLLAVFVPMVGFFTWAESWMAHDLAYRLLAEMRLDLYNKLDPLAPAYLLRRRSGDLVSILGGDIEKVEFFFGHTITPIFVAVLIPAAALVTLGVIAWPLALILAPFLLAVAVSPFFAQKRSERLGEEVREQIGDMHAHMVDSIQGLREILAFGRGPSRTGEMVSNGWRFAHLQLRFLKERAFQMGFIEAMTALGGLAVLAVGLWFKIQGDITRPQLILAVILSIAAFAPISDIARTMKQLMETLAASRRLFAVHDEPVPVTDGAGVDVKVNGRSSAVPSIRFETVGFSYGPGEPQALHDVSFSAEAGDTVALVGRSGAGKTTCANLLMRFWDPAQGRILLGGNDLRDFGLDHLREHIALVTQDTYLFNTSIRENLRLGRQDAGDADIEDAARQANAHDFIMAFPDGYETLVGERGMQLSGGQRQRVSIARALLKNCPVLVLDEATSHLDAVNEQQVRQALERLMEGRTTLVIAHRLSTIRDAHQIVVLDRGQLVDHGNHHELLQRQGLYAQLVATQLVGSLAEPT
jgi:ATP-binding cassette subfamily B protein